MIFLETDLPISGVTTADFPNVRYALPVNFWPENEDRLILNLQTIIRANPQDDVCVTLDSHLFERHFSQAVPANTEAPYITTEEAADNFERAVSGLGVNLHKDTLRQLRRVKKALDNKEVKWVYCRPEGGLWYEGDKPDEAERWQRVRALLVARGAAYANWGKDDWHRFTHRAYNGFLRQVLHFLEWLEPLGRECAYWFSNAHGDELGIHLDDWGNRVPPVNLEPEQWPNLYVYLPETADTQLARAVNFARHAPNAVVHLRIGPFVAGQKVDVTDCIERARAVIRARGHVMLFVGDPTIPQGASWFPPDGSVGAAVKEFCERLKHGV